jgi:predicted TPR repeat methyltransferase
LYLKEKPRNAEKLSIRGYSQEMLWQKTEAVKAYQEVLKIQPYNNEIIERIKLIEWE